VLIGIAYHVPFAFWTLLCLGALFAFLRAVTTPPRDELETRGVFSTLSERLGDATDAARVRRALATGSLIGVPVALGACSVVWRAEAAVGASTLVVIAVGWLFLSIGGIATLILIFGSRR
jgi:hypothetical protein